MLPLGPPDWAGSPYASPSAFAASPGCLAKPDARVTADELEAFVARERYWIDDWAAFAGAGAIADQVRFEREWSALRRYAAERGVRLLRRRPDLRRAATAPTSQRPPGALPARASSPARRPTR